MPDRTELSALTRADCLELLGAGALGRIVFTASAMPAVQPVRYVLEGDEVLFRIADGGLLSTATRHAVVGFQVDAIDPVTHAGWSVLGVGLAYEITDADRRWEPAAGSATHAVAVPLQQLSGQRVRLGGAGGMPADPDTAPTDGGPAHRGRSTLPPRERPDDARSGPDDRADTRTRRSR